MQSCITSSAEQALADSDRRQQEARQELEKRMITEREALDKSTAEDKSEVRPHASVQVRKLKSALR